ncbi:NYN domain-containing protein [Neomicrococcus lactis]|uniref:Uncharacterized LabA/DUF88 family protein n=1 Tax=Neomicrococcus lactis TaxID=732241 RepID=A0A7W9DB91_9MICC|nr:uncharacterized LabA/DUF88 family protein [Neomicrococcus lactis]
MFSQRAIFIDAGFLHAAGGMHVAGTSYRKATRVNHERLINGILKCTEDHSGLDLLRLYWYDAAKDAVFQPEHKKIGLLPGVKVRLGRMSYEGNQKGVDLKLGLDLVGIARNRAASVGYLLSGDDDLTEAVEAAQDLGMKVVLVCLEDANSKLGVRSVAENLALLVDSIIHIPNELIETSFIREVLEKPGTAYPLQPVAPPATSAEVPPNEVEAGNQAASSSSQETEQPRPEPARVAIKPAPPKKPLEYTPPNFSSHESHLVYSSGPHGSGSAISVEEDVPLLEAAEVGVHVATHWYGTVTQQELSDLLADRPVLPADVDRVLLKDCAQRIGELKTDYKSIRQELRRSFWDEIDELVAGKRS